MGSTTVLQVLVVLGICIVIAESGNGAVSCHSSPGCSGNVVTGPTTAEECCLSESGTYYSDDSRCQQCVVFGWIKTEMTAPEAETTYILEIGYLKGNGTKVIVCIEEIPGGTATLDSDFRYEDLTTNILVRPGDANRAQWRITLATDSIAQEPDESFQLRLVPSQFSPLLPEGPNVFFTDTISLTIQDRTEVAFSFTRHDYEEVERVGFIPVKIEKNQQLATPVTLVLTPYTVMRAEEENAMNGRPLPLNFNKGKNVDDDPFSSNRAKESDFDTQPINLVIEADEGAPNNRRTVRIGVTMDDIDEASPELLVVIIEVRDALNQTLISDEGIRAAILRITDDDVVEIGYELSAYTLEEPPPGTTDPITYMDVRIIKSIVTEQTLKFGLSVSPLDATQQTNDATNDFNVENSTRNFIQQTFDPNTQEIRVSIEVFPDMELESVERFRLGISAPDPGTPMYLTGVTLADTTTVSIRDNLVFVIGLDPVSQYVNEDQGYAELCACMTDPPDDVTISSSVKLTVTSVTVEESAGNSDYSRLFPASVLLDFDNDNRVQCFNITINDDNLYENNEQFSIRLITLRPRPDNLHFEPEVANITIEDTTEVTIGFIGSPYSASENMGPMVFMVGVIGDTVLDRDVVVSFATQDGSTPGSMAVAGSDYKARTNVLLTFNAGTRLQDVTVSFINDDKFETIEEFSGVLSFVSGGPSVTISPSEATAIVFDDEIVCEALPPLINGHIEYFPDTTEPYAEGTEATHICDQGFILVGNVIRVCRNDSDFDGEPPSCQSHVDCGPLSNPVNGRVDTSSGTETTDVATYSCYEGYELVGQPTRVCGVDGQWTLNSPTCEALNCGSPAVPDNGRVHVTTTTYNSLARYVCDPGYTLIPRTIHRICGSDGNWFPTQPAACIIVDCGQPPTPDNGRVQTSPGTTYNSVATYSCDSGYTLKGLVSGTCQANGVWSVTVPVCEPVDCGPLSDPTNGRVDTSSGTAFMSTATYSCDNGYRLIGSDTRTCDGSGQWTSAVPQCHPVDCGSLGDPTNGQVDTSSGTTFTMRATYSCHIGYNLVGSSTRTCGANGQWTSVAPECHTVDCGELEDPEKGHVKTESGTTYRSVAVYSCVQGYKLKGSATHTCTASGQWSYPPPTCAPVDCGELQEPINGSVDTPFGTYFNSTAMYNCDPDYNLTGSAVRVCQSNGSWSSSTPFCADNAMIQIKFGPTSHCVDWTEWKAQLMYKIMHSSILKAVQSKGHVIRRDNIETGFFSCYRFTTKTTYRTTVTGTERVSAADYANLIQKWVESGVTARVQWYVIKIDSSCPVSISSMDQDECE